MYPCIPTSNLSFCAYLLCFCVPTVVPSAATIVIVVCVSFLVFMIILGVFRIRAAHQRTMRDQENGKENEMDWDDSALTITVNPMEVKTHTQSLQGGEMSADLFGDRPVNRYLFAENYSQTERGCVTGQTA